VRQSRRVALSSATTLEASSPKNKFDYDNDNDDDNDSWEHANPYEFKPRRTRRSLAIIAPEGRPNRLARNYCPGGASESSRWWSEERAQPPVSTSPHHCAPEGRPNRLPLSSATTLEASSPKNKFDYDYDNDDDNDSWEHANPYEFKPRRTRRSLAIIAPEGRPNRLARTYCPGGAPESSRW